MNKEITNELIVIGIIGVVVYYFVSKSASAVSNTVSGTLAGVGSAASAGTGYGAIQDTVSAGVNSVSSLLNNINVGDMFGIGGTTDTHTGS